MSSPSLACGSILLTIVLKEESPLQLPPHLPFSRASANASMRVGPTMEDYSVFAFRKTKLIADSCHLLPTNSRTALSPSDPSRSMMHDQDFYRTLCAVKGSRACPQQGLDTLPYTPGMVTGNWEGTFMVSPPVTHERSLFSITSSPPPDFLNRQPMQCQLREYFCLSPSLFSDAACQGDAKAPSLGRRGVRSTWPQSNLSRNDFLADISSNLDLQQGLYVLISGETSYEHDQAWGAYNFTGRIRLRDGFITLIREPKNTSDDGLGTWAFEGFLHSRETFVGRWRSSKVVDERGVRGIFCMSKRPDGKGR
jgi:hypothetical protein